MTVLSLQEKRFEYDKDQVHQELVNYFITLDEQQKLWYFSLAIRIHAQGRHLSTRQADILSQRLAKTHAIRKIEVELAIACDPYTPTSKGQAPKVIPLHHGAITDLQFEEKMLMLDHLIEQKSLEYRHTLYLILLLLAEYPNIIRTLQ